MNVKQANDKGETHKSLTPTKILDTMIAKLRPSV